MKASVASVLAVAVVAAGVAWPGAARAVSFLDDIFPGGEWTATKTFDSTTAQNGAFAADQAAPDGNPGTFRQTRLAVTGPGGLVVSHLRNGAVYDPAVDGPIGTISFSLDVRFLGGSQGTSQTLYELDLLQSGAHYLSNATAALAQGPGDGAAGSWTAFSFSGLTASDFNRFAGSGPSNPDFSALGAPIQFGFLNTVSEAFGNPLFVTSGIDNWSVQLHPTPEPATILLLGSSLAGLGAAAAWRKRGRR